MIVILLDDVGFSDFGCYGGEIRTPNIDALAVGGLRFTGYTTVPMCAPALAALLTGKDPHSVGCGWLTHASPGYPGFQGAETNFFSPGREIGALDDTLILLTSDNGASSIGGPERHRQHLREAHAPHRGPGALASDAEGRCAGRDRLVRGVPGGLGQRLEHAVPLLQAHAIASAAAAMAIDAVPSSSTVSPSGAA